MMSSSASSDFQDIGKTKDASEFLTIAYAEGFCLSVLPAWRSDALKERANDNEAPSLLPAPNAGTSSQFSNTVATQPPIINGDHTGRRVNVDSPESHFAINRDGVVSGKRKSDHKVRQLSQGKANSHTESVTNHMNSGVTYQSSFQNIGNSSEFCVPQRPCSLPDFRNNSVIVDDGHYVNERVLNSRTQARVAQSHRFKSVVSIASEGLQRNNPVSRSLNSIYDIQNQTSSFRNVHPVPQNTITDLKNKSAQLCTPNPDAASGDQSQNAKKSCVRRLNLDDGNILTQNSASGDRSGQQALIQKEASVTNSSEQVSTGKISDVSFRNKQLLGAISKKPKDSRKCLAANLYTPPESPLSRFAASPSGAEKALRKSTDVSEHSKQYRVGSNTQCAMINNFSRDSFFVSEKSKSDCGLPRSANKNIQAWVKTPTNKRRDNCFEISIDSDDPDNSEELFTGGQQREDEPHVERLNAVQQNHEESSEHHCFQNLNDVFRTMHSGLKTPSPGLKFTAPQIRAMYELLSRLHS